MASADFTGVNGTGLNTYDVNIVGINGLGNNNWEIENNRAREGASFIPNFDDPSGAVYSGSNSDVSEVFFVTLDLTGGAYASPAVRCGTAAGETGYYFVFDMNAGNVDGATLYRDGAFVSFQSFTAVAGTNITVRVEANTNGAQVDITLSFNGGASVGTWSDTSGSRITVPRTGSGWIAYNAGSNQVQIDNYTDGADATHEQEGYRWRNDDGNEAAATWAENQDTPHTVDKQTSRRLRVLTNTTGDPAAAQVTLQYRRVGDPDSEWRDV